MKDVFNIVPSAIFLFERRYWHTIKDFLLDPSKMVKDYSVGKRKYYAPPLQFFYFLATVSLILSSIFPSDPIVDLEVVADESDIKLESLTHRLEWAANTVLNFGKQYSNFFEMGFPLTFGIFVFIFYRKLFNLAESFVFSFILLALIFELTSILLLPFQDTVIDSYLSPIADFGIVIVVFWRLGERKILNLFLGILTVSLSVLLYVIVAVLVTLPFYSFFN